MYTRPGRGTITDSGPRTSRHAPRAVPPHFDANDREAPAAPGRPPAGAARLRGTADDVDRPRLGPGAEGRGGGHGGLAGRASGGDARRELAPRPGRRLVPQAEPEARRL